jgi:hypothetical protein
MIAGHLIACRQWIRPEGAATFVLILDRTRPAAFHIRETDASSTRSYTCICSREAVETKAHTNLRARVDVDMVDSGRFCLPRARTQPPPMNHSTPFSYRKHARIVSDLQELRLSQNPGKNDHNYLKKLGEGRTNWTTYPITKRSDSHNIQ